MITKLLKCKNIKRFLAAAVVATGLVSCEKSETPTIVETKLFNLQITSEYLEESESGWLMVHDLDGNPVDYKAISNGARIQFDLEKDEMYHLTIMKKIPAGNFDRFYVETVTGINTDHEFIIGLNSPSKSRPFEPNGEFEVSVTHHQELNSTIISNLHGHISHWANSLGVQSNAGMSLTSHSQKHIATTRSNSDEIRYSIFPQPQNGQKINLNFSEMQPFDKVIKFPLSQVEKLFTLVKVLDLENGQWKDSFWLNTNMWEGNRPTGDYQIGFLNLFDNYETVLNATLSDRISAGFHKIGKAPSSIQLPIGRDINMQSTDINNILFSSDITFNNWSGNWRLRDQSGNLTVIWDIWGKDSGIKLKSFPSEFTANYPQFSNLELLQLNTMMIMHSHTAYENLVIRKYVELDNAEETQYYYLMKNF